MTTSAVATRLGDPETPNLRLAKLPPTRPMPPIDLEGGGAGAARYLNYLRHRWAAILLLGGILGSMMALAAWKAIPSKYTTTAMLRVFADAPHLMYAENQSARADLPTYLKTQATMLKSHLVISAAIRDPEIAAMPMLREQIDPVKFLEEELKLEFQDSSEIIRVSLSGEDPQHIAKIVNALVGAFKREVIDEEIQRKNARLVALQRLIAQEKQEVERGFKSVNLEKPDQPTLPKPDPVARPMAYAEVNRLRGQLDAIDAAISTAQDKITRIDGILKEPQRDVPAVPMETIDSNPAIQQAISKAKGLQKQYDYFVGLGTKESNPALQAMTAEIARAEADLAKLRKEREAELSGPKLQQIVRDRQRDKEDLAADIRRLEKLQSTTKKSLEENIAILSQQLAETDGPIDMKKVDVKDRESLTIKMIDRAHSLNLEVNAPPRVRAFQEAGVPLKKEMKKQLIATAFAGLLGIVLVGALLCLLEARQHRTYSLHEVQQELLGPIVGILPDPRRPRRAVDELLLDESVEKARTELLRQFGRSGSRVIALSSALEDEGQSLTALHLARSFGRAGGRVLLIDGNLRQPTLHSQLGIDGERGFCQLLTCEASLAEAVTVLPNGVAFLPAGNFTDVVRRYLTFDGLAPHWQIFRDRYDWIIIATHPVLQVAETAVQLQLADGVLLVLAKLETRLPMARRAQDKIAQLAPEAFGLVFLGASVEECRH